jgi:hypothetical protein
METQQTGQTKSCPKCGELIQSSAKRCKHCQADLRNWFARHKVLTGFGALIIIVIVLASIGSGGKKDMKADSGEAKSESKTQFIKKAMGEDAVTKTMKVKVVSSDEKPSIVGAFETPKTAAEGAKFVVVSMEVTNLTNDKFMFSPDDALSLVDDTGKKYKTYEDTIGSINDYLNVQDLSPNIVKKGVLVYEIPQPTNIYDLFIENEGTKDIYQVKLK